jgi:hypothetical protein
MKRIILIVLSLLFVINFSSKAQIHLEIGGGYLGTLGNVDIFKHNDGGWLIGGSLFYKISEVVELKTSLAYQSRSLNPNSFHFAWTTVLGASIPNVSGGDNLKSLDVTIGGRLKTKSNKIVNPLFVDDIGINFFQDSYYNLTYVNGGVITSEYREKYFDKKVLFETSLGSGLEITPYENFSIIVEARANYIPSERNVYFPITANFIVGI